MHWKQQEDLSKINIYIYCLIAMDWRQLPEHSWVRPCIIHGSKALCLKKNIYNFHFDHIYILKVMTVYFFQNVSLVLPIASTFFYVTVIFGAPSIRTEKLWCAIFGEADLNEKIEFGKSAVIAANVIVLTLQLSRYFFQILLSHWEMVPKKLHIKVLQFWWVARQKWPLRRKMYYV